MQLLDEALLHLLAAWHRLQARAQDDEGQTLAEYGMIMGVVVVGAVVLAVTVFRDSFIIAFGKATDCLSHTAASGC